RVAGDHTGIREPLDAGMRARARDVHGLGDGRHRGSRVTAQLVEDGLIRGIQVRHRVLRSVTGVSFCHPILTLCSAQSKKNDDRPDLTSSGWTIDAPAAC